MLYLFYLEVGGWRSFQNAGYNIPDYTMS